MAHPNRHIRNMAVGGWLIPIATIILCGSYYLRAWIELGYWPTYGNPDPKNLGWPFHHFLILLGILAIYPAILWSSGFSLLLLYRRSYRSGAIILVATAFISIGFHILERIPAVDEFLVWYID